MHIIKRGSLYFDGNGFGPSQSAAKRYHLDAPSTALCAYVSMLLSDYQHPARFVELVPARPVYAECVWGSYDPYEWVD